MNDNMVLILAALIIFFMPELEGVHEYLGAGLGISLVVYDFFFVKMKSNDAVFGWDENKRWGAIE